METPGVWKYTAKNWNCRGQSGKQAAKEDVLGIVQQQGRRQDGKAVPDISGDPEAGDAEKPAAQGQDGDDDQEAEQRLARLLCPVARAVQIDIAVQGPGEGEDP